MPYINLDCNIDIDYLLSACTSREIKYIIKALREDGHLNDCEEEADKRKSLDQTFFEEALVKLKNYYYQLSDEELQTIQNIAKKF